MVQILRPPSSLKKLTFWDPSKLVEEKADSWPSQGWYGLLRGFAGFLDYLGRDADRTMG